MRAGLSRAGGDGTIRVVLDANVVISGLRFGGTPRRVMALGEGGDVAAYTSPFILGEVERILQGDKFGWGQQRVEAAVGRFRQWVNIIHPTVVVEGVCRDADDDRILECCLECNADYLVTGDRDLLVLGEFRGTGIVDAGAFLRIYEELAGGGS